MNTIPAKYCHHVYAVRVVGNKAELYCSACKQVLVRGLSIKGAYVMKAVMG